MIVDYIVAVLFLVILIRIIKRFGLKKFSGAIFTLLLIYFALRLSGKEIDSGDYIGTLIVIILTVFSYETFNNLSRHHCHRKCFMAGLLFMMQLATSPYVVLYVVRLISIDTSCLPLVGNFAICESLLIYRDANIFHMPKDNILAMLNFTAFLLIQYIRKMH